MKNGIEHQARQQPAVERIMWDPTARLWRWRISTATPNGPVVRTGTAETRWEADRDLTVAWSRLNVVRALGYAETPQLRLSGLKARRWPRLRGPGLA